MKELICKSREIPEILKKLDDFGIAVINDFASPKTIKNLTNEFNKCSNGEEHEFRSAEYSEGQLFIIKNDEHSKKIFPSTIDFFNSDIFEKISKSYYKEDNILLNHEIYFCKDVEASDHKSQILHYDLVPTLKFFIYLNDINKENGATHLVPSSHKITRAKELSNRKNFISPEWETSRVNTKENKSKEVAMEGKAGTLVIFHTDVAHRASSVNKGERLLMRGHTRRPIDLPKNWPQKSPSFIGKIKSTIKKYYKR